MGRCQNSLPLAAAFLLQHQKVTKHSLFITMMQLLSMGAAANDFYVSPYWYCRTHVLLKKKGSIVV